MLVSELTSEQLDHWAAQAQRPGVLEPAMRAFVTLKFGEQVEA